MTHPEAFTLGVAEFCKEAGIDTDDRRALATLLLMPSVDATVIVDGINKEAQGRFGDDPDIDNEENWRAMQFQMDPAAQQRWAAFQEQEQKLPGAQEGQVAGEAGGAGEAGVGEAEDAGEAEGVGGPGFKWTDMSRERATQHWQALAKQRDEARAKKDYRTARMLQDELMEFEGRSQKDIDISHRREELGTLPWQKGQQGKQKAEGVTAAPGKPGILGRARDWLVGTRGAEAPGATEAGKPVVTPAAKPTAGATGAEGAAKELTGPGTGSREDVLKRVAKGTAWLEDLGLTPTSAEEMRGAMRARQSKVQGLKRQKVGLGLHMSDRVLAGYTDAQLAAYTAGKSPAIVEAVRVARDAAKQVVWPRQQAAGAAGAAGQPTAPEAAAAGAAKPRYFGDLAAQTAAEGSTIEGQGIPGQAQYTPYAGGGLAATGKLPGGKAWTARGFVGEGEMPGASTAAIAKPVEDAFAAARRLAGSMGIRDPAAPPMGAEARQAEQDAYVRHPGGEDPASVAPLEEIGDKPPVVTGLESTDAEVDADVAAERARKATAAPQPAQTRWAHLASEKAAPYADAYANLQNQIATARKGGNESAAKALEQGLKQYETSPEVAARTTPAPRPAAAPETAPKAAPEVAEVAAERANKAQMPQGMGLGTVSPLGSIAPAGGWKVQTPQERAAATAGGARTPAPALPGYTDLMAAGGGAPPIQPVAPPPPTGPLSLKEEAKFQGGA